MVADLNLLGSVGDLYCFSNTLSMLVIKSGISLRQVLCCDQELTGNKERWYSGLPNLRDLYNYCTITVHVNLFT